MRAARLNLMFASFIGLLGPTSVCAQAPASFLSQTSQYPRYSLTTAGADIFLLDQATGCVWKRSNSSGVISWNAELKIVPGDVPLSICYVGLKQFTESLLELNKRQGSVQK
jgi:hypothetical protein